MKTSITIILTILMLFTSTSGLWYAVDVQNSSDDMTPIARIENDDYVTYANRGKNEDVEVETLDLTSKEYIVTITVMTTATGDIERGNYVESKPIANALVRLDGIPRYTDKQGKIKAYVFNKYVELYVERSGYNPYIEIIDASAGDKVVNLKKPSDDIEIYSAMFEYQGKMFNLLSQPCYVLRGIDFVFSVLTVESNVEVDKLMFYVNGELTRLTFGNKMYFTDKDFDSYGNEDKFTIRICYAGVYSKYQEIFINFNDYNHEEIKAEILRGLEQQSRQQSLYANSNTGLEIGNDQSNIGSIGSINAPSEMTIYEMILDEIMPTDISYSPEFGQFKLKLSITPDFYNGTFEFLIGVEMTPKWVKEVNEKIQNKRDKVKLDEMLYEQAKAKAQMDESEQANIENQKKFDEAEANWKEAKQKFDNTGYLDDKYFDAMRDMYMYESIMNDEYARLTETEDYEAYVQSVNDYEQSVSAYQQVLGEIQDEYDGLSNALDNAEQQFKSASKDASKSLLQYLIDKDKFNQTVEKIEDFFVNKNSSVHTGASFKIDLDFAFMGKVIYSYRDNSFVKASVYCEIKFKVIFSYQWLVTIPTPFPIIVPVFITIQGNIGGRIELTFLENNELLSIENILDDIAISLLFGLRVDGGIGVAASNITAGPYGQVDFKMQFRPNMKLTFQWGAGLKIQFLDFEVEFGYQSDEQTIWSKEDKAALAQVARLAKASAIDGEISENQLFDRIYHASRPQLIGLEDGRKMLIWIEDDADRDIYNSSVVKYSIFDNGEWSSPKAICDDGRGDYAFDVCVKDGDVFVAMQKVNRLMTEQDDLYDTLKSLDIFVSKFDSKTGNFGAVEQITNDNKYDAAPQFAVVDGSSNVTLTWLSNTNDDFMGLTGENVINATQYNGYSWSNSEEIFRNSKLIFSYSCAVENGKTALAIREDKDGDLFTFDSTTYVIKNGSKVFESDTAINPQFINLSDTVAMLYYKEGKLVSTDDFISEEVVVDGIATQEFNISKSGETPALFYESYDGEVDRGYCSLNIDGQWTTPFSVIDEAIANADISALTGYYDNGMVYSTYNTCLVDEEDSSAKTPIALCVAEHKRGYEISIEAIALESIKQGKDAQIMLCVENIGDFDISKFEVDLCGQKILIECESPLKAGSVGYYFIDFVADIGNDGCIDIVTSVNDNGAILASDVTSIFVRYTDLTIAAQVKALNGKQQFSVDVTNISDIDSAFTINVYVNGVLYKEAQSFVSAGNTEQLIFEFDEINEGDYVYFSVVSQEKEFYVDDNGIGVTSIQTEKLPQTPEFNAYQEYLNKAKDFIW